MVPTKAFPSLRQLILRLMLLRFFMPLLCMGLITIACAIYLGEREIEIQQNKVVQSISQMVDSYLEQGGRILDVLARIAEIPGNKNMPAILKSTLEANAYFDTLYYLDKNNKIMLLIPSDINYSGMDMSNLPDLHKTSGENNLIISRPFISLRTGELTVYLVRQISLGGCVVGELNLGMLQQEIVKITSSSKKDFVFIMDQTGTLLAHPTSELVKQQANMSNLKIFKHALTGKASALYQQNKIRVLGSAMQMKSTGWIIVNQVRLTAFLSSYAWIALLILLVSLSLWLILAWNLRKQIQLYVITPLEKLSRDTNTLMLRDDNQVNSFSTVPTSSDELNKLAGVIYSNILEQRKLESSLKKMSANLEAIIESTDDIIWSVDKDFKFVIINSSLKNKIKEEYNATALTGMSPNDLVIENLAQKWNGYYKRVFEKGKFSIENLGFGEDKQFEISFNPIYKDGKIFEIACFGKDISECNKAKKEILMLNAELEQRVVQRTAELQQSINNLEEFSYTVSHDLKAPLRTILGYCDFIIEDHVETLNVEVDRMVNMIKNHSVDMIRLIEKLLSYSKTSKLEISNEPLDLKSMIEMAFEEIMQDFPERKVELLLKNSLPMIRGDKMLINQAITNILSNAIKFTRDRSKAKIVIGYINGEDKNIFYVKDNGVGFDMEFSGKLFGIFERLHTTKEFDGSGIGLATVRKIIEKHGGKAWIEGELNVGATLYFTLPVLTNVS